MIGITGLITDVLLFLATWHDDETPSRPWGHDQCRHAIRVTGRSTAKIIRQRHAKTLR